MVGGGAHHREPGGEIHSVFNGKGLERRQSLVVVHGQRGVEHAVMPHAEIAVRGEGTECHDPFIVRLLDRWDDDVLLFGA